MDSSTFREMKDYRVWTVKMALDCWSLKAKAKV